MYGLVPLHLKSEKDFIIVITHIKPSHLYCVGIILCQSYIFGACWY